MTAAMTVAQTSQQSSVRWRDKPEYVAKAEAVLARPGPVNEITRLVPVAVCDAVLEHNLGETPEIGKERSAVAVAALLSGYPQATVRNRSEGQEMDLAAYSKTIARTIAKFPEYAVAGMIDRKPWGHAFLPTEPEVRDALQDEVSRRAVIISNAKAHKKEARRRELEQQEEARIAAGRGATEAERKLQIQNILAKFNRMDGDSE